MSSEFKHDLEELSSYLASIMQERPIIYLLAKFLRKKGLKFQLEAKHKDLVVNNTHVEFKFNYDRVGEVLNDELTKHMNNPKGMWADLKGGRIKGKWGVIKRVYEDVCDKKPPIFIWIICARDLSKVVQDDLKRICIWREQRNYNKKHPYNSDRAFLIVVDRLLAELQAERPFSVLKEEIVTSGDFPSTYHFRICEFPTDGRHDAEEAMSTVTLRDKDGNVVYVGKNVSEA